MGKKGSGMKILAAVAVCAVVAVAAFVAYNTMGGGTFFNETPDPSDYIVSSIPPTTEASDIDVGECYAPGIDGDSQEFRDLVASEEYRSKAGQIIEDSQRQIEKLKEELNRRVAAEIQSMDAIENASGYKLDGLFLSHGGYDRLPGNGDRGYESLGAFDLRWLNAEENKQMESTKKIDDYFSANIPDFTRDLYERYGIEPSFGHFKSVEDYVYTHMSIELVNVNDERKVDYYRIIDGDKYEILIESYDENLPEGTNLEFIKEFLMHGNENLALYNDITNGDLCLWSDYRNSRYYENNPAHLIQGYFEGYCDDIGEPYASQAKEIKDRIDSLQEEYVKQVEQIVDSSMKKIAGTQAEALKDA